MSRYKYIEQVSESNLIPEEVKDQYLKDLDVVVEEQEIEIKEIKNSIALNLDDLLMS